MLSRSEPVQTNGLHSVIEISAGGYLSLALDEFGQGWSGANDYGQGWATARRKTVRYPG